MLKNKCCLYVIISIRFFSITICNLLIEFPSYTAITGAGFEYAVELSNCKGVLDRFVTILVPYVIQTRQLSIFITKVNNNKLVKE